MARAPKDIQADILPAAPWAVPQAGLRIVLQRLLTTALLFFLAAYPAFEFARVTQSIAIIWPAVGISLALAWLWGPRMILAAFAADFAASLFFAPQATAFLFACGNALALFLALTVMAKNKVAREFYILPRDMFLFLAASVLLSVVSALIGTATEYLLSGLPTSDILKIWWIWFVGDFTGLVFVTPLMVAWATRRNRGFQGRLLEPVAIALCMVVISAVFLSNTSFFSEGYPVPFLLMPFLVWAAFRMGHRELYTFLTTMGTIAVVTTHSGIGLFSIYSHVQSLLLLQSYLVINALMTVTLHCVVHSRKNAFLAATRSRDALIFCLADLAEMRDSNTGSHLLRTQRYVRILCETLRELGPYRALLGEESIDLIVKTAPLHDIGKVAIPDAILLKPGKLTPEEFEVVKRHPENGNQILERARQFLGKGRFLEVARDIVLHHHEKWDGSGYPRGLRGENIPLPARLMALADVYDALTSPRVYKSAIPHKEAADIVMQGSGGHFDPAIVEAFRIAGNRFQSISMASAGAGAGIGAVAGFGQAQAAATADSGLPGSALPTRS